jgi:hypothetical protein
VAGGVLYVLISQEKFRLYVIAGVAGATGAVLSVATRLQEFRLQPCNQSNMNYWMSAMRIGIGVVAGLILFLLAPTAVSEGTRHLFPHWKGEEISWEAATALGLVAGFAERLVPTLMRWTGGQTQSSFGTPAQAVRGEEKAGKRSETRQAHATGTERQQA